MKMSDKYPRNILIPVLLIIIGIFLLNFIYKSNISTPETPETIQQQGQLSVNTKAALDVNATILIPDADQEPTKNTFDGKSQLLINLANGEVSLGSLQLSSQEFTLPPVENYTSKAFVELNKAYPSTGEINLETGVMDVSLNLHVRFNRAIKGKRKLLISMPLTGTIDKNAGVIKLNGEATIPADFLDKPLPLKVSVVANTIDSK